MCTLSVLGPGKRQTRPAQNLAEAHNTIRIFGIHPTHCTIKKPNQTWESSPDSLPPNTLAFTTEGEPLQPLEVLIRFSLSESVHLIYKQNRI